MSGQLLSSKIVVQEEPPGFRTPSAVATGVTACLGITEQGPVGEPILLTSFDDFVKIFGGDTLMGIAPSVVRGFFNGGGERMYFTRVVHYTDITNPLSKTSAKGTLTLLTNAGGPAPAEVTGNIVGPFGLTTGDTLAVARDASGTATATFTAAAATLLGGSSFAPILDNQNVIFRVDGGALQTVTFNGNEFVDSDAPTASEIAAVLDTYVIGASAVAESGAVRITSNTQGTSSAIEVTGGSAMAACGLSATVAVGTGNVQDIGAVKASEVKTVVESAISGVTVSEVDGYIRLTATTAGPSGFIQVDSLSTADDEFGLDNIGHAGVSGAAVPTLKIDAKYDGAYSSSVKIVIWKASNNVPSDFNLSVLIGNSIVETFPNLSMLDTSDRHVESIINASDGSRYIAVTDLDVSPGTGGELGERPANSPGTPTLAFGPLAGGSNGLLGLSEIDFVGDQSSSLGFYSFDLIADAELLICPEVATPAIHNAALSYVSVHRKGELFFIADPPAGMTGVGINNYVLQTAALKNTTEFGAIYWPRVKVLNPNAALYGSASTIVVPPSGHIAGMFARNDGATQGGIYQPPGGVERGQLPGVIGLETEEVLNERIRDLISPNCINPITRLRGQPIAVNDVMTLAPGGNFPTIAERRGVMFIERTIKDTLEFARLRNNDDILRNMINRIIKSFLMSQMKLGAFRSQDPSTAFFVDTSTAINPPSEQFAGRVHVRIGLATQKPARFIILSFSQDTRALDQEIAAAG